MKKMRSASWPNSLASSPAALTGLASLTARRGASVARPSAASDRFAMNSSDVVVSKETEESCPRGEADCQGLQDGQQ